MTTKLKCGKCKHTQIPKQYLGKIFNNQDVFVCNCCNSKNVIKNNKEEKREDYTLREWLDFDYHEYLQFILTSISKDKFEMLKANTLLEIKAGKFNSEKIDTLKEVLKDNFREGNTLNQIAKDIEKKVKPKDLLKLNEDGTIKFVDGEAVIAIPKERRSMLIARSETTRMASEGSVSFYKDKGVEEIKWVASLGARTCPICEELNGQIYEINSAPRPPAHVNCRCSLVPIIKG